MKKSFPRIITTLLLSFQILASFAQAPQKFSYQAVIRNASNTLVTSSPVGMQVSILQGSATGTAVYVETHSATTNINGLLTIEIGNGTPVSGTFASINWAAGPYFIMTETDPSGGTTYTITGTTQLMSVPYALYAETSGSGAVGPTGAAGTNGADGATGATGIAGTNGTDGATGATGVAGTNGTNGATGATGMAGTNGTNGINGATGATGSNGTNGINGATGATGATGAAGSNGTNGINGATGATGAAGINGTNGTNGATGATGANGTNGATGATGATGLAGTNGTNGVNGATGATGTAGTNGTNGTNGATGATGANGTNGSNGATGVTGPTGVAGTNGTNGINGATGATGMNGGNGINGMNGATGATGATGPAGGALEYAYIYNTSAQFVTLGNAVTFDANGLLSSGITHNPGSSFIFINVSGVYKFEFSASGSAANQFSIYLNGVSAPGSRYGSAAVSQQNTGFVILNITAGDVIQLNNTGSSGSINLVANTGGTLAAVNASILITKL